MWLRSDDRPMRGSRFLSKGREVYLEERLTTRQDEARDGSGKRYRTEIVPEQRRLQSKRRGHRDRCQKERVEFRPIGHVREQRKRFSVPFFFTAITLGRCSH